MKTITAWSLRVPWHGSVLALTLAATLTVACDTYHSFYVRNDTTVSYFARVTVPGRDPALAQPVPERVYVYEIEPRESGYVGRGISPGLGGPGWTLELLDPACSPIETWRMPEHGGQLQIRDGTAEFSEEQYFEDAQTGDPPSGGSPPAVPADAEPFESVLECGATDVF